MHRSDYDFDVISGPSTPPPAPPEAPSRPSSAAAPASPRPSEHAAADAEKA